MIATEGDRRQTIGNQRVNRVFDESKHLTSGNRFNITSVEEDCIAREVRSIFAGQVPGIGTQGGANLRRRIGGAFGERRVFVVTDSDDGKFRALFVSGRLFRHAALLYVRLRSGAGFIRWCTRQGSTCDLLSTAQ